MNFFHCFVEMTDIHILLGEHKNIMKCKNPATLINDEVDGKHYIKN